MYILPDMIEIGLKDGEEFNSEDHRFVAVSFGIANPQVTTKDQLIDIVQAVQRVPQNKIKKVSMVDLRKKYGMRRV